MRAVPRASGWAAAPLLWPLAALVALDGATAAVFAAGTLFFDPRLAVTPHLSANQILAALALVGAAWTLARGGRRLLGWDPLLLVGATTAVLALSLLWTPAVDYGWVKTVHFAGFGLFGCCWAWSTRADEDRRWIALLLLGGVGMALGLGGLFRYLTAGWSGRLAVFGGGPIVFSRWVGTGLLIYLAWLLRRGRYGLPALLPLLLPLGLGYLLVLLLSNSKGSLLGFMAGLGYLVFRLLDRLRLRTRVLLLITGLVAGGVAAWWIEPAIFARLLLDPTASQSAGSYGARMDFLRHAAEVAARGPLQGLGAGGWAMDYHHLDQKLYPHNLPAEVLVELGPVLGGLLLASWFGAGWRWWRRAEGGSPETAPVLKALTLFWSLAVLFSGDLTDSRVLFLVLAMLAAAQAPCRQGGASGAASRPAATASRIRP